jgi:hypothetical protein
MEPRLISALQVQLNSWRTALAGGAQRVGWKLGMGERERIGNGPVIGHLTSATRLEAGGSYRGAGDRCLHADAELALELGTEGAIVGYGAALELVDLGGSEDPEAIVGSNVFHRAVVFGPMRPVLAGTEGRLLVDGHVRDRASLRDDYPQIVAHVAQVLAAVGERLLPGDRLITGSIVQVPVAAGEHIVSDLGPLGCVEVLIE